MNRRSLLILLTLLSLLSAWLIYEIRLVVIPFFLAFLLAYFLDPAVDWLERLGLGRTSAVAVVFAAFVAVAGAALALLIPAVHSEIADLREALPRYAQRLYQLIPGQVVELVGIRGGEDLQGMLERTMAGARDLSLEVLKQVALFLSRAFSSTFNFILAVLGYFIIPVYLFYLLRDFDGLMARLLEVVPPRHRQGVTDFGREVDRVLGGFVRGQLSVCLVLGVLYAAGLSVIGIDLALVIGFGAGAVYIIPYLGTLLGASVAGVMAVVKFHDWLHPLMVVGWFALVQALEGTLVTPKLVGNRVGLHPVATILAVLAGGELFGFLGMLLAVPTAAIVKISLRRLLERYRSSSLFHEDIVEEKG